MAGSLWALLRGRVKPETDGGVTDRELLRRYAAGRDEAAFELLVWRYSGLVLGVCRRTLRDGHAAEDAAQAVFLILARKAGTVRSDAVGDWLHTVARRVAARAVRTKVPGPILNDPVVETPPPDDWRSVLDAELARLPERFRLPVMFCYLQGLTTEQAAARLGVPRGTVLSRLAAARTKLAGRLTRRGVTLPAAGLAALGLCPEAAPASVARWILVLNPVAIPTLTAQWAEATMRAMELRRAAGWACGLLSAAGVCTAVGVSGGQTPAKATEAAGATRPSAVAAPEERDRRAVTLEKMLDELQKRTLMAEAEIAELQRRAGTRTGIATAEGAAKARSEFDALRAAEHNLELDVSVYQKFLDFAGTAAASEVNDRVERTHAIIELRKQLDEHSGHLLAALWDTGPTGDRALRAKAQVEALQKKLDVARTAGKEEVAKLIVRDGLQFVAEVRVRLAKAKADRAETSAKIQVLRNRLDGFAESAVEEGRIKAMRDDLQELRDMRRTLQRQKLELDISR